MKPRRINEPQPNIGARVRSHETRDAGGDLEKPVFSMQLMPGSHCVDECDASEQAAFARALWKRSQLTWRQLRQAPRDGLGYEKIESLNVPLPSGVTDDVSIIAFRFDGKKPMVGYKDGVVFHVLWLDRAFNVYDHGS